MTVDALVAAEADSPETAEADRGLLARRSGIAASGGFHNRGVVHRV
ncbi:hypothetical protein ACFQ6E_25095 [Streptomyces sp. NPDC056462]